MCFDLSLDHALDNYTATCLDVSVSSSTISKEKNMSEVTEYLPSILISLSATLLALMSPGPNVLAVIGTSMSEGRRHGAALGAGVAFGSFLWALIAVLGLTALLTAYAGVLIAIKIVGGCYLLWLGYKSFKSALTPRTIETSAKSSNKSLSDYFIRGLTIQMSNPKAALAMTAIVTIGIQGEAPSWVSVFLVLGISLLSLVAHLIYAIAFSTQPIVDLYITSRRWVEAALGSFFCFAGIKLLTDRT